MTRTIKIFSTICLFISLIIMFFSLAIYTSPSGLHYLVIIYDSIIMFILGIIFTILIWEIKNFRKIGLTLFTCSVLLCLPIIIDDNLSDWTIRIGLMITILSIILVFRMLYLYWWSVN